jgi:hypothetical protein
VLTVRHHSRYSSSEKCAQSKRTVDAAREPRVHRPLRPESKIDTARDHSAQDRAQTITTVDQACDHSAHRPIAHPIDLENTVSIARQQSEYSPRAQSIQPATTVRTLPAQPVTTFDTACQHSEYSQKAQSIHPVTTFNTARQHSVNILFKSTGFTRYRLSRRAFKVIKSYIFKLNTLLEGGWPSSVKYLPPATRNRFRNLVTSQVSGDPEITYSGCNLCWEPWIDQGTADAF